MILTYLYVLECEYDWVGQVHFVAIFVDGSSYNRWVDNDCVVSVKSLVAEFHAGIFRGKVQSQMFIEYKCHANLTYGKRNKTAQNLTNTEWKYSILWYAMYSGIAFFVRVCFFVYFVVF